MNRSIIWILILLSLILNITSCKENTNETFEEKTEIITEEDSSKQSEEKTKVNTEKKLSEESEETKFNSEESSSEELEEKTEISAEVYNADLENNSEKNYSIKTDKDGKAYYIIEKDYEKEYTIHEIFSGDYDNNTYPELKQTGVIFNYNEYKEYCELFGVKPAYTDETSNYIVLSYGSGASWVDLRLSDVEYDDESKNINLFIWEATDGIMGSGSGYILVIPTNKSKDYSIGVCVCITEEWFKILTDENLFEEYIRYQSLDKPVIYLYPEEETKLNLTLDIKGELTTTYPEYKDGWSITAQPDGTLVDSNGREYNYLFWEGQSDIEFDFDEGFCIKGEDTLAFLEDALTQLGLTDKEQADFITYWLPKMQSNKYNIISFQNEKYTQTARLEASCEIDTEIRVFMAWKASDEYVNIKEQKLSAPKRTGFTLVEWGGSEVK